MIEAGTRVLHPYYGAGTVLEREYTEDGSTYVAFDAGEHDSGYGGWWVSEEELTICRPMSEWKGGHHPTETGLQKHSVGNAYPLHIVGYGTEPTLFTIENMKTGEVLACLDDQPRCFSQAQTAADVLDAIMLRKLMQTPVRWAKGRPVRHASGQYLLFKV